jgi:hypothetical protein
VLPVGVCVLPSSDLEALRAFLGTVNRFLSLAKEALDRRRLVFDVPAYAARADTLLQTMRDQRQPALVAGVHVGEPRPTMVALLSQCIDLCGTYGAWEKAWEQNGHRDPSPFSRLTEALAAPRGALDDLAAVAEAAATDGRLPPGSDRRELFNAFGHVLGDTPPPLNAFLDLGRQLRDARLYYFIEAAIQGNQLPVSYARNILVASTRHHVHENDERLRERLGDEQHANRLLSEVIENGHWPYVRDELLKFLTAVEAELEKRQPPEMREPRAVQAAESDPAAGLNRTDRAVLAIIKGQPKGAGLSGGEIVIKLQQKGIQLAESSLRKHTLPKLKRFGVISHPAAGGSLIPE